MKGKEGKRKGEVTPSIQATSAPIEVDSRGGGWVDERGERDEGDER